MKTSWILKTASLVLVIVSFISCDSPSGISGKLEGVEQEGTMVYLIQPATLHDVGASYFGKVVDSALVNSNGSFTFGNLPKTNESVLFELAIQPSGKLPNYLQNDDPTTSNYMPIVWQLGEPVQITANVDAFQKSFSIKNPSDINAALIALRDVNQKAYQTYLKDKHWEIEDGNQLMEKEHAHLQYQAALMEFANNTTHLLPALVALRWVSPINDYERVPEFLVNQCEKWNINRPGHPWTQELCYQGQRSNLPILLGDKFPNFMLPLITNDTLSLYSQLGSKLTIIDLWASWCAPCRIENREILVPIWDVYHDNGVQIIGYSLESNAAGWIAATEKDGANRWLQASELQGDEALFLQKIRVRTIPSNFMLNADGVVVAKNVHGQALVDWVKNYLD